MLAAAVPVALWVPSTGPAPPPTVTFEQVDAVDPGSRCTPGADGKRVEVLVAVEAGSVASRFRMSEVRDTIVDVERLFNSNGRRVRWVTDPLTCEVSVTPYQMPAEFDGTTDDLLNVMKDEGKTDPDRKYLVLIKKNEVRFPRPGLGGIAYGSARGNDTKEPSQQPAATEPGWAFAGTSSASIIAHEMLHTFGAVKSSAPNADETGHCVDEYDVMCYEAHWREGGRPVKEVCRETLDWMFDCNNDDYWNLDPEPGSYLDTHWNTADSPWLEPVA